MKYWIFPIWSTCPIRSAALYFLVWTSQCSIFEVIKVHPCDLNKSPPKVMPSPTVLLFPTIWYSFSYQIKTVSHNAYIFDDFCHSCEQPLFSAFLTVSRDRYIRHVFQRHVSHEGVTNWGFHCVHLLVTSHEFSISWLLNLSIKITHFTCK